jgi:predicted cobalt transporter CbtA
MLVGIFAGLLVFVAAHWLGEPQVERAIAFEAAADQAKGEAPEPETVSRHVQRTFGLVTATVVFGASIGGIFGLIFAYANGRIGPRRPRSLAAFLAGLGFVAITLVPSLKYPANPPAVGNPDTIGIRTGAYFLMIFVSIAATVLCLKLSGPLIRKFGDWNGVLAAGAIFLGIVAVIGFFLPSIDEVPAGFPADVLWRFRLASWALQLMLWTAIGLLFGWLTERQSPWRFVHRVTLDATKS